MTYKALAIDLDGTLLIGEDLPLANKKAVADANQAGFNELQFPAADLLQIGGSPVQLIGNTHTESCRELFAEWKSNPDKMVY